MKAYILHDVGALGYEDISKPLLKNNEVLVRVKAAGICGSDIPRIYKTGAYSHPLIPGHEFAGEVAELGGGTDTAWLGKRVGIFPLIPCKKCGPCQNKQYEMCRSYTYLGSRRDGGFAEYVAVPAANLIEIPENVSFEEAAMLEPMAVAVHAMRRINPKPSDRVVVCGLGTIGLLLAMFLKEAGVNNIFAIGNKEFQKLKFLEMGFSEEFFCDSRNQDIDKWIAERTDGGGTDVFFECVGKNETIINSVNNTAPGGKIMLVGNPYSDMALDKAVYWKVLRNQLTIMGTWNSSFTHEKDDDWHYVLDKLKDKRITPAQLISHCFPFAELEEGLQIMRDKKEDYVKILIGEK